jgi:hypothetical protein
MHKFRYRTEHYNNTQGAYRSTKVDSSTKVLFSSKCRDQNKLVRDGRELGARISALDDWYPRLRPPPPQNMGRP